MSALIRWANDGLLDEHAISDIEPMHRQTETQGIVGQKPDFPENIGEDKYNTNVGVLRPMSRVDVPLSFLQNSLS